MNRVLLQRTFYGVRSVSIVKATQIHHLKARKMICFYRRRPEEPKIMQSMKINFKTENDKSNDT